MYCIKHLHLPVLSGMLASSEIIHICGNRDLLLKDLREKGNYVSCYSIKQPIQKCLGLLCVLYGIYGSEELG